MTAAIDVKISGSASGLSKAAKQGGDDLGKMGDKSREVGKLMLGAFGAAGAIEAAKSIGEATDKEEIAQAKLATALKNSGTSWDANAAKIGNAVKTGEKYGYSSASTKDALAALTTATGSSTKALALLPLAQNVAAESGKDLTTSAIAVAKAQEGNLKPLKALAIDLPIAAGGAVKLSQAQTKLAVAHLAAQKAGDAVTAAVAKQQAAYRQIESSGLKGVAASKAYAAADKGVTAAQDKLRAAQGKVYLATLNVNTVSKAGGNIIAQLSAKMKGQAAAAAETFGGKVKALKAKLTDVEAAIGLKVIPIIEKLAGAVVAIVGWFSKGSLAAKGVEVAIGALTAAFVLNKAITLASAAWNATWAAGEAVVSAATGAATAAQWLFNAALSANPIVLVIAAVVGLGVAVYEAYKHFGPFRAAVDAAWQILQTGFDWVKGHWPLLLAILTGPIGLAVLLITKNWSTISSGAASAFDAVVGFVKGLPGRVLGYVSSLASAGLKLGSALLGGLVSGVEGLLGKVGDIGKAIANTGIRFVNIMLGDIRAGIHDLANALANVNVPGVGKAFDAASSVLNTVAGHIPNVPSFDGGGIVPGAPGSPQLILAHGGENVQTRAQQRAGGSYTMIFNLPAGIDAAGVVRAQQQHNRRNGIT